MQSQYVSCYISVFILSQIFNIFTPTSPSLSVVKACVAFGVIRAKGKILCPFTIISIANIKVSGYIAEDTLIGKLTFDYTIKQSTPGAHIGRAGI